MSAEARRALAFLMLRSWRNKVAALLRHLREPRRALVLLLGAAYVVAAFGWTAATPRAGAGIGTAPDPAAAQALTSIALAVVIAWAWLFPADRTPVTLPPAEAQLLLPAPLGRATLVRYRLLRAQVPVLFTTLIWTLLLQGREGLVPPGQRLAGLWVLVATLATHRVGASFTRARLRAGQRDPAALAALAAGGVLVACAAVALATLLATLVTIWQSAPRLARAAFEAWLASDLTRLVLAPFGILARPLTTPALLEWTGALAVAAGVLALHYLWVTRGEPAPELLLAETATARPATRAGRTLLPLAPGGWPALALTWRHLAPLLRPAPLRRALLLPVLAIGLAAFARTRGPEEAELASVAGVLWAGLLVVFGPFWVRRDLRADLGQLPAVRALPLPGRQVLAAEALGSTLLLALMQAVLLAAALVAAAGMDGASGGVEVLAWGLAALLVLPLVDLVGVLLVNVAALFVPGWVSPGSGGGRGVEGLGQSVVGMLVYVVALVVVTLPASALSFVCWRAASFQDERLAALAAAAGALPGLLGAAWLLTALGGRLLDRAEPVALALSAD